MIKCNDHKPDHTLAQRVAKLKLLSPNMFTDSQAINWVQKLKDKKGDDVVERALFGDGVVR